MKITTFWQHVVKKMIKAEKYSQRGLRLEFSVGMKSYGSNNVIYFKIPVSYAVYGYINSSHKAYFIQNKH